MVALLLEPDLVITADGAVHDGPVRIEHGRVVAVGAAATALPAARVPLPGRMLLPGFVNGHSHAFQRALRGRVERRSPEAPEDDFWSWRERMYACALEVDGEAIELLATWAYADMVRSGFTAVGEFHYLHHAPDGSPWGNTSVERMAAAAARVGIRLVMLQTGYERAGPQKPATDGQRRFLFKTAQDLLAHAQAAASVGGEPGRLAPPVTHGLAIHSVRACSRPFIEAVAAAAQERKVPLHVHACEQPAEIATCKAEHNLAPLGLLAVAGALGPRTTVVHATHIDRADIERLARSDAAVCLCPSTERNLGDGLCPIADLHEAGVRLAIGTDSHARIDVADELRSLEDHERLRTLRRIVLRGDQPGLGGAVLAAGTRNGAASLGLEAGGPEVGAPADLVAVSLPVEGAAHPDAALDAWLVGGSGRDVTDVWVAGRQVLADGRMLGLDEDGLRREVAAWLSARG